MKKVILIGSGGVAAEVTTFIDCINSTAGERIDIVGIIDDSIDHYRINSGKYGFSYPYLGTTADHQFGQNELFVLALASIEARMTILKRSEAKGLIFMNVIHPSAQLSKFAKIGQGNLIYPNCVIGPNCEIGNHNILTSFSFISHDSTIGNNNFFATGGLSGNVRVGHNNYFGIRSVVLPGLTIGSHNVVQAGMVVDKNVTDHETVFYRYKEKVSIISR